MRPSPPLHVTIDRFGVWRTAVGMLATASAAAVIAWRFFTHDDAGWATGPAGWGAALAGLGLTGAAATLLGPGAVSLRWDAQRWHLGPPGSAGHEPVSGGLRVAMDVGGWMLLRFDGRAASGRSCVHWIPAQKSSLGQAWHALRCAVYSPRPESGEAFPAPVFPASTRPLPPE